MTDIPITDNGSYKNEFHSWKDHFITKAVILQIHQHIDTLQKNILSIPVSSKLNDGISKCMALAECTGQIKALQNLLNISYIDVDECMRELDE